MDESIQEHASRPESEKPALTYNHNVLIVGDTRVNYWAEDLREAFTNFGRRSPCCLWCQSAWRNDGLSFVGGI